MNYPLQFPLPLHPANLILLLSFSFSNMCLAQTPRPPDAEARAILSQMTLDEKIGQMVQADLAALKDRADIAKFSIGSVLCGGNSDPPTGNKPADWAAAHDDCQAHSQRSRLKIPLLFGVDAVHGHSNVLGAVIFPHNVGIGATRNPTLAEQAGRVAAQEIAATGIRWTFAPCVAVARDERWGRTYESFGEDPLLASDLGAAVVRGFQGGQLNADPTSVLACPKHYLGDGGTTNGKDQGNMECDEAAIRRLYLPAYIASVKAGAGSVMVSYSSWNGVKMHAQKHLLTDVLKNELGFDGLIVSDWAAIDQIDKDFRVCVQKSIDAGLDLIMIPNGPGQKNSYIDFITILKDLVSSGAVSKDRVDDAALRILRVKARMGILKDAPKSSPDLLSQMGSPAHRELARQCVRESLVLLKNDRQTLPLAKKNLKRLHIIGPAAKDLGMQCGGWTIDWQGKKGEVTPGGTTIFQAFTKALGNETRITYSDDGSNAKGADVVVAVIGEPPYAEGVGDRADLSLSPEDLALVSRARQSGVPVVSVLLSGRPVILGSALDDSDAFVAAWLPGTEGQGVTDVLLGDQPFRGKLPHTWPRSMDQIPANHDAPLKGEPLFPFGFGLTAE